MRVGCGDSYLIATGLLKKSVIFFGGINAKKNVFSERQRQTEETAEMEKEKNYLIKKISLHVNKESKSFQGLCSVVSGSGSIVTGSVVSGSVVSGSCSVVSNSCSVVTGPG